MFLSVCPDRNIPFFILIFLYYFVVSAEFRDIYLNLSFVISQLAAPPLCGFFYFHISLPFKQTLMQLRTIYGFIKPITMENSGIYSVAYGRCLL